MSNIFKKYSAHLISPTLDFESAAFSASDIKHVFLLRTLPGDNLTLGTKKVI